MGGTWALILDDEYRRTEIASTKGMISQTTNLLLSKTRTSPKQLTATKQCEENARKHIKNKQEQHQTKSRSASGQRHRHRLNVIHTRGLFKSKLKKLLSEAP